VPEDVVIRAEGLGKKYRIGHRAERERYAALRDTMARGVSGAWRRALDTLRGRAPVGGDTVEEFWALKDISFEVKRGEVLGVIGRNGAGKSTLLKILSRITEPSAGRVTLNGRVASLLEVGTGFHPELTGRENIYLNGAILGMSRAEIRHKFDEIVAFAEVEKFLDTPVKRYSSGMYVRLAFAVAAHLEPEILVVDEVLAVGDAEFQKKCLGRMDDVARREGRTVLFVSHSTEALRRLCSRGILLQDGQLRASGAIEHCVSAYLKQHASNAAYRRLPTAPLLEWRIDEAWIEQGARETSVVRLSEPVEIVIRATGATHRRVAVEFILRDQYKYPLVFCPSGLSLGEEFRLKPDQYVFRVKLSLPALAAGRFYFDLMLAESGQQHFDLVECALWCDVAPDARPGTGWVFAQSRQQGAITLSPESCRFTCESVPVATTKAQIAASA
jgi:lipopolysaccharide transport system ATP-binding protein